MTWRFNSYGYPTPFSAQANHRKAWDTLQVFFRDLTYGGVKQVLAEQRGLDHAAAESWKAHFEGLGLLWVPRGTDEVIRTVGGNQFVEAAVAGEMERWAWVALNLLLRYPLRGPRGNRRGAIADSDILPFWFLYAALLDLDDTLWFAEVERVIPSAVLRTQAQSTVEKIAQLRLKPSLIEEVLLPYDRSSKSAHYNSLNQLTNNGSLGKLTISHERSEPIYSVENGERLHRLVPTWKSLVEDALGGASEGSDHCDFADTWISRMPAAPPRPTNEEDYFSYLGAQVPGRSEVAAAKLPSHGEASDRVLVLSKGTHYKLQSVERIVGPASFLCQVAIDQRVVLSHNLEYTYLVREKARQTAGEVVCMVQRARPISDPRVFVPYIQGEANVDT